MTLPVLLALLAVQLLFASLAITAKFVLPVVPATALVLIRLLGGTIAFGLAARLAGDAPIAREDRWRMALLGVIGIAANQVGFLVGLKYTTAIHATILVATIPVLTAVVAILAGRERFARDKAIGIGLAVAGTLWLIGPDRLHLDARAAFGNLVIELGMLAYAGYLVWSRDLVRRYGSLRTVAWFFLAATIAVLPVSLPAVIRAPWEAVPLAVWGWIAWIVIGPTIATYYLNLYALRRTSATVVAGFIYLQPVVTAIVAPLVLEGEAVTPRAVGAGMAILLGLVVVLRSEAVEASALRPVPVA